MGPTGTRLSQLWIKRESTHGFLIKLINEDEDAQTKEGQVQKINSSVKLFINKGQGCAEKSGGRWEKTQHPFSPFFVMKTVTQLLKSNPQCCCEYLRGLQWRDTPVHEQNNRFKMENRLITFKYYGAKSCTKPHETLGNRGTQNHAFMVSPNNTGCLFTDSRTADITSQNLLMLIHRNIPHT